MPGVYGPGAESVTLPPPAGLADIGEGIRAFAEGWRYPFYREYMGIDLIELALPVASPDQPLKIEPDEGAAVRVTVASASK